MQLAQKVQKLDIQKNYHLIIQLQKMLLFKNIKINIYTKLNNPMHI